MYKYSHVIIGFLLLLLLLVQGCKRDVEFVSVWRQQEISVDGDDAEWRDHLTYFDKKSVAIGVKNDSTDLYLVLRTTDPNIKQLIMRNGFTVWFNAKGKKKRTFGIHYPVGLNEHQPFRSYDAQRFRDHDEEEKLRRQFFNMLSDIEIIGPGDNERNRFSKLNPYGFEVGITDTSGALIYELKIPLVASTGYDYQIGAAPGDVIRIGFETGKAERPEGMRRNPGAGMGGGKGEMRGGGAGGRRPHAMESTGDPVKFWIKLHLADNIYSDEQIGVNKK